MLYNSFPSPYGAWVSSMKNELTKEAIRVSVPLRGMGFIGLISEAWTMLPVSVPLRGMGFI